MLRRAETTGGWAGPLTLSWSGASLALLLSGRPDYFATGRGL
jgi:hypothetical protein